MDGIVEYSTKAQKGSPSRDKFKWLHKQMLPTTAYALDADLELVSKKPMPFIVALLDFKVTGDSVSFTEAIAYKARISSPLPYYVPVYIIEASPIFRNEDATPAMHRFTVYQLVDADYRPNPPTAELKLIAKDLTWEGLSGWEMTLRANREEEIRQWMARTKPSIREQAIAYVVNPS